MKTISIAKVPYTAKIFYMFMMFMWVASVSDYTSFNFGKNPIFMPVFLIILAIILNTATSHTSPCG